MPETVTTADAQYALDLVKEICQQVGPGVAGSPQELTRAAMIKRELETHLGVENVTTEGFQLAPGAFLGSQIISTMLMLAAALLNTCSGRFPGVSPWITAAAALIFSTSALLLFIFEFVLVDEVVDPLFKKHRSVNVVGRLRKPGTKDVKRLLILSGHHDSAFEFTWLRFSGYGFFVLTVTWMIAQVAVLIMSAFQFSGVISDNAGLVHSGTIGWILWIYPIVPSIIFALFYARGRKIGGTVPGAADNLSACAIAVAMCRFLVKNPAYIPDETEIRFITFGGEEAGVRGSRRYVHSHLDELKSTEARLLNFETIVHPQMIILSSETNGSVQNSPAMVSSVVAAAQRAGVPYKVRPAMLGTSSDAGRFSQAGLKATTLVGFTVQQMIKFYHQERDTPAILSIEPLQNALKLTCEWIRCIGEQGKQTIEPLNK
jgi:hypothetical protein